MTSSILSSLGTELVWQFIGSMLAAVLAVAAGLPILRRAPVAPARLLAGAWLAAALPLALTRVLFVGWASPGTERLRVTTFAAEFLLAPLTAGPAIGLTALFLLAAGARGPGRTFLRAAVLLAAGLGMAAALGWVGHRTGNWPYADLRAAAYVACCLALGLATLTPGPREEGGPDAGAAAAALLPLVVGLGEASERGLVWFVATSMTHTVSPASWPAFVSGVIDAVALERTVSWAVLAVAVAASGIAAARRESPARWGAPWLVSVAIGSLTVWGSELSEARLAILAPLCTGADPASAEEERPQGQEQADGDHLPPGAEPEGGQP